MPLLRDIKPGGVSSGMADDILRELHTEETSKRDASYTDAFGQPGGPGWYVEKAAWATAYAKGELKRLNRPKYKITSGGKRVRIGGPEDVKSKEGREAASKAPSTKGQREECIGVECHGPVETETGPTKEACEVACWSRKSQAEKRKEACWN